MNQVIQILNDENHRHKNNDKDDNNNISEIINNQQSDNVKSLIIIKQSPYGRRIQKKLIKEEAQDDIEIKNSPVFMQNILKNQKSTFPTIMFKVQVLISQQIQRYKKIIEDKVYNAHVASTQQYLQKIYLNQQCFKQSNNRINQYLQKMLSKVMEDRENNIIKDIDKNQIIIIKHKQLKKNDLQEMHRLDQLRLIKIREGEIKSKLDIMNDRMEQMRYLSESSFPKQEDKIMQNIRRESSMIDNLQAAEFRLASQKTKKAQQYIKKLRQIKKSTQKKKQEERKRKAKQQEQLQQQRENHNKLLQKEKHILKIKKIEENKKIKQEKKRQFGQKHENVMKLLSQVNKHNKDKRLYKKIEQQFQQKYLIPQLEQKTIKLMKIKELHHPLSKEELQQHQKKYLDLKVNQSIKRQQQWKNMISQRKKERKKIYTGKYYEMIISKQKQIIPEQETQKQKKQKRDEYSHKIRLVFQPKVNQQKHNQLLQLISKSERKNRKLRKVKRLSSFNNSVNETKSNQRYIYQEIEQKDPKIQGIKYLDFSKQLAKQHLLKIKNKEINESKEINVEQNKISSSQKNKSFKQNTQSEIFKQKSQQDTKKLRYLNSWRNDVSNENLNAIEKAQRIKIKSMLLDKRVQNKQMMIRNMKFSDPFIQIKMKSELDDEYLNSIKAKVAVLDLH